MENKCEGNENKIKLGDLILLLIKWTGMMEIKHKDVIDGAQRPRICTHMKFANSAKTNQIMVSLLISSAKGRWKYTKSCFKENARTYSKNSTTQGNTRISRLKKRLQNLYEKKYSNHKLNQLLKIYKINFTNWKTNKQKVQNFVLPSNGSLRAKNALKLFSKYLKERIY